MAAPASPSSDARNLPWLDAMRAAAALLVLVSHARDLTLRDAADQPALSAFGRAFYALSGLGHQAVIVFFVLSGFLVTRSMRRLAADGRWSLLRFGLERLSRLWLVLIPCLLLGGLLDAIGISVAGQGDDGYGALTVTVPHGPPARDAATLLGNMLFLQTLMVPVYGSNGPLWSLADEAWFYALGALAFSAAAFRGRVMGSALAMVGALALALWLPCSVLALFPVWLCGAACAFIGTKRSPGSRFARAACLCFVAVLTASRLRLGPGSLAMDWLLGLATAWLLVSVASLPWPDRWWSRPALGLSALSYTLYLSHVPVLALLTACLIGPQRHAFDDVGVAFIMLGTAVALALAAALWWAFERHTPAVRRSLLRFVSGRPATGAVVIEGSLP